MAYDSQRNRSPSPQASPRSSRGPSPGKTSLTSRLPAARPATTASTPVQRAAAPGGSGGTAGPSAQDEQRVFGPFGGAGDGAGNGAGNGSGVSASFERAASGPASEVPYRAQMEQSFGTSFGGVSAHLGAGSAVRSLGGDAAAVGDRIAFAAATPSPKLVAHELAHVVQARHAEPAADRAVSTPADAAEREADSVASRAARGQPVTVGDRQAAWMSLGSEDQAPGDEDLIDPLQHPEWPRFRGAADNLGIDPGRTEALWRLIIDGIRDDKPDNFQRVADELFQYMQVGDGEMALWSGGLGMSDYAISRGKKTLESRDFYQLTSGLKLYRSWEKVRPVWAALSAKFVSQCRGQVHCYLRGYSETSIFGEIEHNILLGLGDRVDIVYHACAGPDGQIVELQVDGTPRGDGGAVDLRSLAEVQQALAAHQARA